MMARKAILGILTVWAVAGQALGTVNLGPVPFADPNFAVRLEFWSTIPGDIQQMTFLGEKLYFGVQPGQVWEYDADGNRQTTPFLDVAAERAGSFGGDPVGSANGLRGIAFHPDYTQMGRPGYGKFYTMHTESFNSAPPTYALDPNWNTTTVMDSVLYEWTFDPTTQQRQGSREVLRVQYPYGDHIGQQIAFNPTVDPNDLDYGKLYLTFGDGGGPCAPSNTCNDLIDNNVAQNTSTVLGSIVRIDPLQDGANPYAIPADNPFVGMPGYLGEIWAYGFRNPQTLSFDTATGKLLVGNISHNNIEEIELIEPGNNYGWAQYEGTYKFAIPGDSSSLTEVPLATRLTDPITYAVTQFDHASNGGTNAVVGGFVYHGAFAEKLEGYYLFGTLSRDRIFIVKESDLVLDEIPTPMYQLPLVDAAGDSIRFGEIVGVGVDGRANMRFGQDQNGEVYVISKANDSIYRFDTRILISIVSQPVDQVVAIGQTASFTVNAIDPLGETLVYQWFFDPDEQINGNEIALQNGDRNGRISGADTATLMVANVDESADRGLYYVEVDTESLPAVTSVKARLAVGGCVAHYTFDDDTANDSSGNGNHGILAGTATIANDPVRGKVLVLDGIGGKVDLGNTASLNITGEITIAAWIKSDVA